MRKPIQMILSLLLLTAVSVALCVGACLLGDAARLSSSVSSMFTAIIQADIEKIDKQFNKGSYDSMMDSYQVVRNKFIDVTLDIAKSPLTSKDDRRLYFGAAKSFVPLLSPIDEDEHSHGDEHDSGEEHNQATNPDSDVAYRPVVLDVLCKKVYIADDGFYEYVLQVNEGIAHHTDYGNFPSILYAKYNKNFTFNGGAVMEEDSRYLIAGECDIFSGHISLYGPQEDLEFITSETVLIEGDITDELLLSCVRIPDDAAVDVSSRETFLTSVQISEDIANRWFDIIQNCREITSSLTVLTTNNLNGIPAFNVRQAYIIDGEVFAQEDYQNGERVCIISADIAQSSGLTVGSRINIAFREVKLGEITSLGSPGWRIYCDPLSRNALLECEYTIIGIYRAPGWEMASYAFTPNTVFIPSASMPLLPHDIQRKELEDLYLELMGEPRVTYSLPLLSGYTIDSRDRSSFYDSLSAESKEYILVLDQGYEYINPILVTAQKSALLIFLCVSALWLIVVILLLYINITRTRKEVAILRSMGATRHFSVAMCFFACFVPWMLSLVIGSIISIGLYDRVEDKLYETILVDDAYGSGFSDSGVFSNQGDNPFTEQSDTGYKKMLDQILGSGVSIRVIFYAIISQIAGFTVICLGYALFSTQNRVFALLKSE